MGPFLPLHHSGSWAFSIAYTHVKQRDGQQCQCAAYCMCVVLCCISATKPDMFCHSLLQSVMFCLVWVTHMYFSGPGVSAVHSHVVLLLYKKVSNLVLCCITLFDT